MAPATATKPSARELRRSAKALKIRGWEDMSIKELQAAIDEAEGNESNGSTAKAKSKTAKAAPAKASTKPSTKAKTAPAAKTKAKASDKASEAAENGNPFKEGTNLWHITEELLAGGKRSSMVKRLKRKITLKPRVNADDFDEDYELDRRLMVVGQILQRDHGFEYNREGRGEDGTIQVVAP